MNRTVVAHRMALAAMILVTTWSILAWGGPDTATMRSAPASKSSVEDKGEAPSEGEEPAPLNWTDFESKTPPFIAMIVNFGILAAGYYLLGRKPIASGLVGRRDAIARDIAEAQRMREEAEERAKVYQAKLEKLEEEVRTAREALVRAGEAERDRIVSDAEAKAERMRRDVEFLVEQELKQIRQDVWREAVDIAVATAQEMLVQRITPADQERLAEDYLEDLASTWKGASGRAQGPERRPEPEAGERP